MVWSDNHELIPLSASHELVKEHVDNILDSSADLQRTTFLCGGERTAMQHDPDNVNFREKCATFTSISRQKRRIHLNFLGAAAAVSAGDAFDVSLVTQFTIDRLRNFEQFAGNWEGPIVAVVYATDAESRQLVTIVQHSKVLSKRRNIAYHVVYRRSQV